MDSETVKLPLEFPRQLVKYLWNDELEATDAIKTAAVIELFRQKRISLREGSELLGMSYREFEALVSSHQVSAFGYEAGWADREAKSLEAETP